MTWSLSATGEIKDLAGKTLEDLERELFDAIGPVLSRYGAFASSFGGRHITGAPHQTTSDAAAPAGITTGGAATQVDVSTTAPDPADTGTPFTTEPAPSVPVDPPAVDVPLPDPETEAASS